jgi:hypothetical protein
MKSIFAVVVVAICSGCATTNPSPDPVPLADCPSLCNHAEELGCDWAAPTPKGAPGTEFCENAQAGPLPWNFTCSLKASICAAIDACSR